MDLADQLQKLQTLREQGGLTDEEFTLAKKRVLDAASPQDAVGVVSAKTPSMLNQFRLSTTDKWLGGVCGGLAKQTNIPTWSWRILFLLAVLLHGLGVLVYLLFWIFVPVEPNAARLLVDKTR